MFDSSIPLIANADGDDGAGNVYNHSTPDSFSTLSPFHSHPLSSSSLLSIKDWFGLFSLSLRRIHSTPLHSPHFPHARLDLTPTNHRIFPITPR
jgi:hypothetical protein